MAVVDSLEVEIQAKAKQSSKEIDVLCGKLGNLSSQLSSIDSKGLQKFSSGLSVFSTGMKTLKDLKMPDFTRTVKGLKKFESIDGQKLAVVSNALNPLAGSLRTLGNTNFNNRSINGMVSSIARLTSSVQGGINTSGIDELGNAIAGMINTLSSAGEVAPKTSSFVNALSRLANAGEKTSATASGLPKLSRELKTFMNSMKTAPTISKDTTELTNAIARLASAGTRTNQTAAGLENLAKKVKEFMASMQNAPQVSQNTLRMVTAMGNLASAGQSAGTSLNSISARGNMTSGMLSRLGGGFKNVVSKMTGFGKESKNIASSIGMFYAKFFMVIRGIKSLGGAIGSAQDYIEEFNYFSVAMDKVGRDSAKKFKEAGYNSAEEYANSFRSRFATLQKQMTGYDVNYDTGEALSSMTHNLGLDLTQVMNFNAAIVQITNSAGMLGETSINTSKALSMLAADWSSLANLDLETTMQNMQSGITGNSRVLYKYGLDTTKAGLAQTALAHGISANVTSMNQQEKMQLRVLTMLEQSKVAYGDLARTINQPANQLRMLEAGFKRLSMTIGSLFMPMIQKLYPYLNAIVIVLQEFAQWVAKLAGIKLGDYDNSTSFPDFEDAADGADDYADSTKKASKAQKKLNDNLQDFDIAKKLDSNKNNDGSGNSKKNGNGAGIDLSKDISDALANYEKVWNKAFKSNKNKAVKIASEIKKALLSGWKTGDFTKLGTAVGNWINKALSNIPWTKIQNTVKKLAKSIATFLNGAIEGTNWSLVGSTIGNSLNTVFSGLNTFFRDFNWLGLGQSLAEMFNSAVKKTDFSLIGQTLGNKLRGMIQFAYGAITTADFDGLGKKISDGINGFFKQMGEVRPNTGLTGWQELGESISKTITGFATTINTALAGVKWEDVGKAIGQFLGSINWVEIWGSLGSVIANALKSILKISISALKEDPAGVIGALSSVFMAIFTVNAVKAIFGKTGLVAGMKAGMMEKLGEVAISFASGLKTKIGAAVASSKIGQLIASKITFAKTAIASMAAKLSMMIKSALGSVSLVGAATALAAIGAAIVAGMAIADRINEAIDAINFTGDYEIKVPAKLELNAQKANEELAKTQEYTAGIKKDVAEINKPAQTDDGKNVEELANKYYELSQKTNPTASDIAVLKTYSQQLSDMIPGFSKNVDKQTGAFKGNKDELNGLVGSLDRAAKAQAAYNSSVELYEKQLETASKKTAAQEKLAKAQKELAAAQQFANTVKAKSGINSEEYKAQVRIVGRYATKVNAARAEVESLNSAEKTIKKQIDTNNTVMENAKVKTSDYVSASTKLKKAMKDLGVSTDSSKKALKTLQEKLDNGEISWKAYKEVVDGNYKSVGELNTAIGNLTSKEVSVTAKVDGSGEVDKLGKSVKSLNNKEIFAKLTPKLKAKWYEEIKKELQSKQFSLSVSASINKVTKDKLQAAVKSMDGTKIDYNKLTNAVNSASNTVTIGKEGQLFVSKSDKSLIDLLKKYGINYSTYATGGFPEDGWFRANHGEVMGKFDNGKSVVANNEQITNGIANAVGPAVYSAVSQAMSENSNASAPNVYLDKTKITKEVMSTAQQIARSRGSGWQLA